MAALVAFLALAVPAVGASAPSVPAWQQQAVAQLAQLKVKPAATMTGYSRDRFGQAWTDVDDNGCNTRDDILQRDLNPFTLKSGSACRVSKGTLHDPYTGKTINFVRGVLTSTKVQIDHVVALADAWRTGAKRWKAHRRLVYANDPDVLLAVDGPANEQKSDSDASEWLPPKFTCRYVADQIAVKKKYSLWVTSAERSAMQAVLASC
jgi:Protein of unknown function (DUF1524)